MRLLLLLLLLTGGARAQPVPITAQPAPITVQQAQDVLTVLHDDQKRAAFEATLDAMVHAGAEMAKPAAPTSAALEPDSLAEQLIRQAGTAVTDAGKRAQTTLRTVNDLPLLGRWLETQVDDADARARIVDAAWRLLVVLAAAGVIQVVAARLLFRLRARAGEWSPSPEPEETAAPLAKLGFRRRSLARALGALRRAPFVLARLILDLLPVVAFVAVTWVLMREWLAPLVVTVAGQPSVQTPAYATVRIVVQTYAVGRLVLAVVATIASPDGGRLRLLDMPDGAAKFITSWAWRLVVIAGAGWMLAEIGFVFGMYQTAHDAVLKLFALVVHGCAIVMVLQARRPVSARIRSGGTGLPGAWNATRTLIAETWHIVAILYLVALWVVWVIELRNGYQRLLYFFVVTSAVLAVARLLTVLSLGLLDRLRPDDAPHPGVLGARAAFYAPAVRFALSALITIGAGFVLLEAWGFGTWSWLLATGLGARTVSAMLTIGVSVLLAVMVWEWVNAVAARNLDHMIAAGHLGRAGRLRTLLPLLRTTLLVVIVLIVGLMALSEIGVNIAPLLAGAGVVGIAVGFGSQKLVQDLITGLFLLLENAMQVGDVVTLGGLSGTVEALSIRTIRLRALDGSVHIIPFSAVTTVTNQTRDYGYALLDLNIGLNEEPDRVTAVVRDVAATMRAEPRWASSVLDALEVMGVERFVDNAYVLRVRLKTQPTSRWSVGRELNRRVKIEFDALAIESPMTSYKALSMATVSEESA